MGKHLNPLEKEFLIRQYKGSTQKMSDFCEKVGVSTGAFQKWLKQYDVQDLCALMGVSRSGYYNWKKEINLKET